MQTVVLLFQLGWRNLWRNSRRNLLLAAAIGLGVASIVVAAGLLRGWQADLQHDAVLAAGGHLDIMRPGYRGDPHARYAFAVPAALAASLDAARVPWTARVAIPAVLQSERETRGINLVGVDPAFEARYGALADAVLRGESLHGVDDTQVLLGAELARRLRTRPGKRIVFTVNDATGRSHEVGARVAGTFDVEGTGTEISVAFVGRAKLQHIIAAEPRVTEIALQLPDDAQRRAWQRDLHTQLPAFEVLDWRGLQPQIASMVDLVDAMMWIWFAVLLTALSFGVANTLITAVLERARELGLMFVLGMRRGLILQQVIVESMLVVALGLAIGLATAAAWLVWLREGLDLSRWAEGLQAVGGPSRLVPNTRLSDVVLVGVLVLVLGLLSALYPAWRAVRLDPLEALHGRKI